MPQSGSPDLPVDEVREGEKSKEESLGLGQTGTSFTTLSTGQHLVLTLISSFQC